MELRAVIQALSNLPDDLHIWVMTDSAYVKNGILEWLPNWIRNHWRTSSGGAVANRTMWERLMTEVSRMHKVQWAWVKGHKSHLLNEVADSLATMGVQHLTPFENVQYLHSLNEDSDHETYTISKAGETPGLTERANAIPGTAYVMKDGDNLAEYISGSTPAFTPQATPQSSAYSSAPVSDASSVSLSEGEESDTQQPPPESEPEDRHAYWDNLGSQGCASHRFPAPHGGYLTVLTEPCMALPRKCLCIEPEDPLTKEDRMAQIVSLGRILTLLCPRNQLGSLPHGKGSNRNHYPPIHSIL
jgi:ribonuclease HI